ncbi:MAG: SagB/ThcOx family dehydrogenase [Candidatus Omnitrophota bacterium]|nr:SagB/ThcOx family dehydrogenase [Candidatus Omnitrophota bacterium]
MYFRIIIVFMLTLFFLCPVAPAQGGVKLPEPEKKGKVSVEEAIQERRSVRDFTDTPLTLKEVSQILWAAGGKTVDGITGPTRAYPSAGGLYPLEIYFVAGNVTGVEPGIYRYDWIEHSLVIVKEGDYRAELAAASWGQRMISEAPATIVIALKSEKVMRRYGQRGISRYISMDAGHLGQNVHLIVQSMGLGTVMIGAFSDQEIMKVMGLRKETPIYIMPLGHPLG